jgi:hypothetical protein
VAVRPAVRSGGVFGEPPRALCGTGRGSWLFGLGMRKENRVWETGRTRLVNIPYRGRRKDG